jgi:tetratricopeptide (TPR) repeat protein
LTNDLPIGSPQIPTALYSAAVVLWRRERRDEAIQFIDEALRRQPDFADALCMGGYILSQLDKPDSALAFYQRALELDPGLAVAHLNAGKLHFGARRFAEALNSFDAATELSPSDADAWCSRAGALRELGRMEESLEAARRALALRPDFREAAVNLGNALLKLDRPEEALEAYRQVGNGGPWLATALCGQALALRSLGRLADALQAFEAAETLGSREALAGKGCLFLTLGDFDRGLPGYEARWLRGKSLGDALGTRFPTWKGPGRKSERVLVLNDHGLGDTIQFFRYLPLMTASGVDTSFVCPPSLIRLLSSRARLRFLDLPPIDEQFDSQIAISSLPYAFGTRLDTIPDAVPYLAAEAALQKIWLERIGSRGFKIGVVWQGNPDPEADPRRSTPLSAFAPLAMIPGVRLISLQKGQGEEQTLKAHRQCGSRRSAPTLTRERTPSSMPRRR